MTNDIPKHCTCGHPEKEHRFRDFDTPEKLLEHAIRQRYVNENARIEIIHDPNRMIPLGYKVDGHYYTHQQAIDVAIDSRENKSQCNNKLCSCKVFKRDNLKYLEDLSERTTGKIIH